MKNLRRYIFIIITIMVLFIGFKNLNIIWNKSIDYVINEKFKVKNIYKGLNKAIDFTIDEEKNIYIAYKNKVEKISNNGKKEVVFFDNNLDIYAMELYKNKLYFPSKTSLMCYDLSKKEMKECITGIPNFGDYKYGKILIKDEYLYLSIGAATNSGVVGKDNLWVKENPYGSDLSPKKITLRGINFGNEKTGAFVPYKTQNTLGQIISAHFPGTASLIIYDVDKGYSETFAFGIRNIMGMDYNSESKIYATVGGIENRGLRGVLGDKDSIYQVNKGIWYGWPDYTGGEPITSFKNELGIFMDFILDNHFSTSPPLPVYKSINGTDSLEMLKIDRDGYITSKDLIYFYNKKANAIQTLDKEGKTEDFFKINDNGLKIKGFRILKDGMLVLFDDGTISKIYMDINKVNLINGKKLMYYIIGMLTFSIIVIIKKLKS